MVDACTTRSATVSQVTTRPGEEQHLSDLARLRRVRDRIDREYSQPLDVAALARGAYVSAGHFSREFRLALSVYRKPERAMEERAVMREDARSHENWS